MGRRLGKRRGRVTLAEAPLITDRPGPVDRRAGELLRNAQVVAVEVDDPYALEPGDKVIAFRSLRDDPIERLFVRGQIDLAQRDAGAAYRRDLELAEFGGARAIDPTKEAVDGGRFVEPFTDLQRKATARLIKAGVVLGLFAESIVRTVVSSNLFPGQVAVARGFTTKRDQAHYRWIFRKALEQLADVYGTASGQRFGPGY